MSCAQRFHVWSREAATSFRITFKWTCCPKIASNAPILCQKGAKPYGDFRRVKRGKCKYDKKPLNIAVITSVVAFVLSECLQHLDVISAAMMQDGLDNHALFENGLRELFDDEDDEEGGAATSRAGTRGNTSKQASRGSMVGAQASRGSVTGARMSVAKLDSKQVSKNAGLTKEAAEETGREATNVYRGT